MKLLVLIPIVVSLFLCSCIFGEHGMYLADKTVCLINQSADTIYVYCAPEKVNIDTNLAISCLEAHEVAKDSSCNLSYRYYETNPNVCQILVLSKALFEKYDTLECVKNNLNSGCFKLTYEELSYKNFNIVYHGQDSIE